MASGFTPANTTTCDDCHSDVKSGQAYYRLEIEKNLCDECAIKHQDSIKGLADQVKWTCHKHTDRVTELFCVTHDYPICQWCALTSNHTYCQIEDIDDVRKERVKQLSTLIRNAQDRGDNLKENDVEVGQMTLHLTMISKQVSDAADEDKESIIDKRDQAEKNINAEYDEKIRKLNEKRSKRLKHTRNEAEQELHEVREKQKLLEEQVGNVKQGLETWKHKLEPGFKELAASIREAENLIMKQENLMRDFRDITRRIHNDRLDVDLSRERQDRVKRKIEKIEFIRENGLVGTVEGLEERWDKIRIPLHVCGESSYVLLLGCYSGNSVVIKDENYIYAVSLDKTTHMIIRVNKLGLLGRNVVCYNALSDGGHVFGTTDGKLMVYDQLWNYARTIATKFQPPLVVTVNKDGLILAAGRGGSSISVFHPSNGKCQQTIKLANDIFIRALKTMSTGDMIVLTTLHSEGSDVYIVDRSGVIKWKTLICGCNMVMSIAVDMSCVYLLCMVRKRPVWTVKILRSGSKAACCDMEWQWSFDHFCHSLKVLAPGWLVVSHDNKASILRRCPGFITDLLREAQQ